MAQNFNFDIGDGSWFCDNNPNHGEKFGRLYNWEAAWRACPKGWHLPTDKEWNKMVRLYGGYTKLFFFGGNTTYEALKEGGYSGLNLLVGGERRTDGSFHGLGHYAQYWHDKANKSVPKYTIFRGLDENIESFRLGTNIEEGVYCRYIKNP